jgi:hypothetical protein
MGLLDEAISDHLELKRQRGADPNQVAREEQEALGPAVRRPAEGDAPADAGEPADAAPSAGVDTPDAHVEEHPVQEHAVEAPAAAEAVEVEPPPEAETFDVEPPPEPAAVDEVAPPEAEPAEPPEGGPPPPSQETAPFDADDLFADEDVQVEEPGPQPGEPEGEDVLEETPEFLQETPEHDRLWFEQKPPRDFDFDG